MTDHLHDLVAVLDDLPSLVGVVDDQEQSRYVNRASRFWLGREPGECVGRTVRELVGDGAYEVLYPRVSAALAGVAQSFERTIALPGGDVVHALTNYVPRWRDQRPDGFTVLVTDVTRPVLGAESAHAEHERLVDALISRSKTAASLTDNVLQELFAISLHLERMLRFPDQAWTAADIASRSLSETIETLRATIKYLASDVGGRTLPEPGGDAGG